MRVAEYKEILEKLNLSKEQIDLMKGALECFMNEASKASNSAGQERHYYYFCGKSDGIGLFYKFINGTLYETDELEKDDKEN